MAVARHRVTLPPTTTEHNTAWDPAADPAFTALLDHLAEVLAHEYVRLMEQAVQDASSDPVVADQEG